MSHTPQNATPSNADSISRFQPPSSPLIRVQAPSADLTNNPENPKANIDPKDYWNDGKQHQDVAPAPNGNGAALGLINNKQPPVTHDEPDQNLEPDGPTGDHDGSAATGRKSVQFARPEPQLLSTAGHSRQGSWDGPETPGRHKSSSIMSKLKALATAPSSPSLKSPAAPFAETASQSVTNSPTNTRSGTRLPDTLIEEQSDADADADVDDTADESAIPTNGAQKKRKRRMRRFKKGHLSTPSTPIRFATDVDAWGAYNRLLRRRASMPDTSMASQNPDQVMSDGDARGGPARRPFRRGHSYVGTTMRPPGEGEDLNDMESSAVVGRRAGHVRRITVFGGGGVSDGDALTPRRPFFNSERASNFGAQKWKQVKSTLKLLRQKKEDRFDYFKSAELMAELRAGAPAVLMLASMIQRDEHGNKRIPVLLEQLKLKIQDSAPIPDDDKERHWIFTIELEYGSGPSRMSWTVIRTIKDIYNLHFRYRFALNNDKYMLGRDLGARPKQPKFPYSAFPYLRRARNKDDDSDEEDQVSVRGDETGGEGTGGEATAPEDHGDGTHDGQHQPTRKKSRANLWGMRRRSTGFTDPGEMSNAEGAGQAVDVVTRRQRYVDKQRRILEKYLSEMIRWLMFRADSNRLCRFLELSALGVRLAAEGSYHGKEGYLHIQSSKGLDFRRVLTPAKVIARHSRKWFLVRQSYIVCVESPENMNIYDVYLVDCKFSIVSKKSALKQIGSKDKKKEIDLTVEAPPERHHTLTLHTSERKVRLFSRNQSVMKQFEDSINEMLKQSAWYQKKRFNSFAPVRNGVFAQWLVDGRDYMWNVSRAINMAKDVIYIHDWWLSPELYMRRPACISQKWRLDRLLQKKAREGVKIFVIIYRNVEAAIPIDSEYTKFSLLNLHPNIFVQRSPNQFKKNQFFFAHHEKICIVDHDVAFLGGIDLCFGRWDCPQHPIVDDKPTGFEMTEQPKDAEHCQLFPGKDYSNPRVQDFFRLNEPYEEMYDRSKVPRMPWHDVSMQVVGQPARDLTRHFVQRWNYLRRGRKPTRPLPFLLPPPDAKFDELEALGLTGTCEVQMLRSASTWSLGTDETEHSIQNAYIKMIEDSDHFVYMENQFFITSTEAYNTKIVNRIGDALVERIIRAYENGEDWRCAIMIPLMPGFQNTVDEQEGTSVRLILMCQYKSICRGEQSIFGRLRAVGIEPEDYISFYCLRQWGVMSNDALVTEQLYIHAKTIIVDDRVALIGSANINERSMLGSRDSECAAIVRDTDMITSTMAGKPYQVGRFAHTLRLRLMREHLGLDIDEILEQERQQEMDRDAFEQEMEGIYREDGANPGVGSSTARRDSLLNPRQRSFNYEMDMEQAKAIHDDPVSSSSSSSSDSETASKKGKKTDSGMSPQQKKKQQLDVSGYGPDQWRAAEKSGLDEGRDSVIVAGREVLVHAINTDGKGTVSHPSAPHEPDLSSHRQNAESDGHGPGDLPPMPAMNRRTTEQLGLLRPAQLPPLPVADDTDIGGPAVHVDPTTGRPKSGAFHAMAGDIKPADITKDCMRDPLLPSFFDDIWNRAAVNNTKIYRRVFRCMPDSEVTTWQEYREYMDYGTRFRASMEGKPVGEETELKPDGSSHMESTAGGAGIGAPGPEAIVAAAKEKITEKVTSLEQGLNKLNITTTQNGEAEISEKTGDLGEKTTGRLNSNPTQGSGKGADAPSTTAVNGDAAFPALEETTSKLLEPQASRNTDRKTTFSTLEKPPSRENPSIPAQAQFGSVKKRRRATTKGSRRGFTIDDMPSRADAEELLKMIQGNVVQFPYDWLLTEEQNGNWGYQVDGVAPLSIYD
ncbi:phospholipase D1 (PLD1) [Pochonia chlamydosporia 170]|uniref:Phospholipase D1 n=1 Tax=Pochonia chlamydosporia 170 TaxID=1380566 RepID=A0A179G094_METCM|nr:phospholipase D1 (PLD1) [Pochonia chlamydosporia 170]OAQ70723.1 phospholipase D1 (PLD1) [Pochonia chlamydosporia 170]